MQSFQHATLTTPASHTLTQDELNYSRAMITYLLDELQNHMFTKKKDALDAYTNFLQTSYVRFTKSEAEQILFGNNAPNKDRGLLASIGEVSWKSTSLRKCSRKAMTLLSILIDMNKTVDASFFKNALAECDKQVLKQMRFHKHIKISKTSPWTAETTCIRVIEILRELRPNLIEEFIREKYNGLFNLSNIQAADFSDGNDNDGDDEPNGLTLATTLPQSATFNSSQPRSAYHNNHVKAGKHRSTHSANYATTPVFPAVPMNAPPLSPVSAATARGNVDWKSKIRSRLQGFFTSRPAREELEQRGLLFPAKVFGVALTSLENTVEMIEGVPLVLRRIVEYFLENEELLRIQGLFRISGNLREIHELKMKFEVNNNEFSSTSTNEHRNTAFSTYSPHSVAGLLKMYLRELPEPLLTFDLYPRLISIFRSNTQLHRLDDIITALPFPHARTWEYLMNFLAIVSSFSSVNLMSPTNISICFAPNVLRPRVETLESIAQDSQICIGVCTYFLANKAEENGTAVEEKNPESSQHMNISNLNESDESDIHKFVPTTPRGARQQLPSFPSPPIVSSNTTSTSSQVRPPLPTQESPRPPPLPSQHRSNNTPPALPVCLPPPPPPSTNSTLPSIPVLHPPPLPTGSAAKKISPVVAQSIQQANANVPLVRPDISSPVFTNLAENLSAVLARRKEMLKSDEKEPA